MKKTIDIIDSTEAGFAPIWNFESWRLAMILDAPHMRREAVTNMSKHMQTDEVFVLLNGAACIYIGDGDETPGNIVRIPLQQGKAYVVHAATWHATTTEPGCKIFVVENEGTGEDNSASCVIAPNDLPQK